MNRVPGPNPRRLRSTPPHGRRPNPLSAVTCPAADALADRLRAADDPDTVWATVHGPLIGPDDDPDRLVVGFVFRSADAGAVLLHANKLTDYRDPAPSLLRRHPGTDLFSLGLSLPADTLIGYHFSIHPAAPGPEEAAAAKRPASAPSVLRLRRAPPPLVPPLAVPGTVETGTVETGTVTEHRVATGNLAAPRRVWHYRSAGAGPRSPLLVMLDGAAWLADSHLPRLLDALVARGALRPLHAVLVDSVDPGTRAAELGADDAFRDFVLDELMPWAAGRLGSLPPAADTVVCGQSLGGLSAAFLGLQPDSPFGAVIAQSGSWWYPNLPGVEPAWFSRAIAGRDVTGVRWHLATGAFEWELVDHTRRVRDVLRAAGAEVTDLEYSGGHEPISWRAQLPTLLAAALGATVTS